jgi:hypothetical protein
MPVEGCNLTRPHTGRGEGRSETENKRGREADLERNKSLGQGEEHDKREALEMGFL